MQRNSISATYFVYIMDWSANVIALDLLSDAYTLIPINSFVSKMYDDVSSISFFGYNVSRKNFMGHCYKFTSLKSIHISKWYGIFIKCPP